MGLVDFKFGHSGICPNCICVRLFDIKVNPTQPPQVHDHHVHLRLILYTSTQSYFIRLGYLSTCMNNVLGICHQFRRVARPRAVHLNVLPHRIGVDPEVSLDDASESGHDDASDENGLARAPLEGQRYDHGQAHHRQCPEDALVILIQSLSVTVISVTA